MKLPSFCRNSGSRRKWRRWGAPPDGGKVCFSGGWECPSAAARALPGRGGALWVCFSERAAVGRCAGPAVRGRCGVGAGAESRRGVCFSVGGGEEHARGGAGDRGGRRGGHRGGDGGAGSSRSPSRFRESPRRDRVRGRRCRARPRSGG